MTAKKEGTAEKLFKALLKAVQPEWVIPPLVDWLMKKVNYANLPSPVIIALRELQSDLEDNLPPVE